MMNKVTLLDEEQPKTKKQRQQCTGPFNPGCAPGTRQQERLVFSMLPSSKTMLDSYSMGLEQLSSHMSGRLLNFECVCVGKRKIKKLQGFDWGMF